MGLDQLILQYLSVQKQLNLSILLPQYILNYQQNNDYDIVGHIQHDLNNDAASEALDLLINEKVFISNSLFIEKLEQWYQQYFNKISLEQQKRQIMQRLETCLVETEPFEEIKITSDLLLLQLAQLEYDKDQLSDKVCCLLAQGLYQYYERTNFTPHIEMINGDEMISGLEVSCYIINQTVAIFTFRGSQTKFFQEMSYYDFHQSRLDWQYNLRAIVQGTTTTQYQQAIQFIEQIKKKHANLKQCFATGHSLGGHLVQLVQIVHHYFDDYVVSNSSPLQLKQLFLIAPNQFTAIQWQQLFQEQNKEALLQQWGWKNTGRIYQYASDLINIAREIPQTFYYGHLVNLPGQPYFNYQPYLQQCFTSEQLMTLTTVIYEALNIKDKEKYDFVIDLLQTILFNLLSPDQWQADSVQLVVNLLKYLNLNNWLSQISYDKCLTLLKDYHQSFESNHQLNYFKRTALTMQLQYQMYKGLNITLLKAIASMHRLSGHWLSLEEREKNEYFY